MHIVIVAGKATAQCTTCGLEDHPTIVLQHIRDSRRWDYLGIEWVYGEAYHMWEHRLTKVRYAWHLLKYVSQNTK
jgi:hypothetical protein